LESCRSVGVNYVTATENGWICHTNNSAAIN
jgi:hypothetical protein